jgi:hypothetical protein
MLLRNRPAPLLASILPSIDLSVHGVHREIQMRCLERMRGSVSMIPFVAASFRGGGGRKPSEVHSRFGPFRLRVGWFCMANQNGRESDRD